MSEQQFDWKQFHADLDVALATWITEDEAASIHAEVITFVEFSNSKRLSSPDVGEAGK